MNESDKALPSGWTRCIHKGRVVYSTPPPFPMLIRSRAQLKEFHQKRMFMEVSTEQLIFSLKRKNNADNDMLDKDSRPRVPVDQFICSENEMSSSR